MARYAIIRNKIVETVTEGDGNWTLPQGYSSVQCGTQVNAGDTYNNGVFTSPAPPALQIPEAFAHMTVSEFLAALVAEGVLTQTRMNNILNRLKR